MGIPQRLHPREREREKKKKNTQLYTFEFLFFLFHLTVLLSLLYFRGSNIMCPGLTSLGGKMDLVKPKQVVKIVGEGTSSACAIGYTLMSTDEIQSINKGVCIENVHYLNDGLWTSPKFS